MEKEKIRVMDNHHKPEKKNGAAAASHAEANSDVITIVVHSENYQIEIEIY